MNDADSRNQQIQLDSMKEKFIAQVNQKKQRMIDTINQFITDFIAKFTNAFEKEQKILLRIMKIDFDKCIEELKNQLQLKQEKIDILVQLTEQYKLSPTLTVTDPIMKIPLINEIKHIDIDSPVRSPSPYKKKKMERACGQFLKCPQCSLEVELIGSLRLHLSKDHNIVLKFKCLECEEKADDYQKLASHILQTHSQMRKAQTKKGGHLEALSYYCKVTKKYYNSKMLLQNAIKDNNEYYDYE